MSWLRHGRIFALFFMLVICGSHAWAADDDATDVCTNALAAHKTSSEWLTLKDIASQPERLIYIGETHNNQSTKTTFAASMADMKAAGITHIGAEF